MTEQEIQNLCALHGCVARRVPCGRVLRYEISTHDGLFVIDWSFDFHSVEWYARELEAAVRKARKDEIEDIRRPYD